MKKRLSLTGLMLTLALITSAALFGALPVLSAGDDVIRHVSLLGSDGFGDGTETWVDVDESEDWTAGDTGPFLTIQHGIDEVPANGIVYVAAGEYFENLAISKSLTIRGAGIDTTNVTGIGFMSSAITIDDSYNVIIDGFTLTGEDTAIYIPETMEDCNITVRNCRICETGGAGIYASEVGAGGNLIIENNIIEYNPGDGIWIEYITNGGTVNIRDNPEISNNFRGISIDGLGLNSNGDTDPDVRIDEFLADGAAYLNITGNTINGNSVGSGIRVIDQNFPSYLTIRGNTIEGNNYPGISLDGGCFDMDFYENSDTEDVSVLPVYSETFFGASVLIDENDIVDNNGPGISLSEMWWFFGANVTIEDNLISGNDAGIYHGFLNDNDTTITVRDNTIVNNSVYGAIHWDKFEDTISIGYSSSYTISGNTIAGNAADEENTTAGINAGAIGGGSSLLIQGNTIGPYDGPGDDDYGPNDGDAVYVPAISWGGSVIIKENKIDITPGDMALIYPIDEEEYETPIIAVRNWWGDGVDYAALADICSGDYVVLSPWYSSSLMRPQDLVHAEELGVHNQTQNMDFDTIQQAIDAAASGDNITIAAGTYPELVGIGKSLTLQGAGAANTFITGVGEGTLYVVSGIDVTLDGLNIRGNGSIYIENITEGNNVTIKNCSLNGIWGGLWMGGAISGTLEVFGTAFADGEGDGLYIEQIDAGGTASIHHNTFTNCGKGIELKEAAAGGTLEIEYNTFTGNGAGVYIENTGALTLPGMTFRYNSLYGNTLAIDCTDPSTIEGPIHMEKNWWGANDPDEIDELLPDWISFDPWYMSENMDILGSNLPIHNIDMDMYYSTIQAAIDAAESGDTITVTAGTYHEAIYINTSLTLQGAGAENTVITSEGMAVYGTVDMDEGIDVTLEGLTFTGENSGCIHGIPEGNKVTIKNCSFTGSWFGLGTFGGISGTLEVFGTAFDGSENFGLNMHQIDAGGVANIHHNTFTNCGKGIALGEAAGGGTLEIEHNTFTGNGAGVFINNTGALTLPGMTFRYNSLSGNTLAVDCADPSTIGGPIDMGNNWWGAAAPPSTGANAVPAYIDADPCHLQSGPEPDTDDPATNITNTSLVLNWTTPAIWAGDYLDFRYSTGNPDDAEDAAGWWKNATRVTGEPIPVPGAQSMIVCGLQEGVTYYFALAIGYRNVTSAFNVITAATETTIVLDETEPAAVTELGVDSKTASSITLKWKASGDDGTTGFADSYIIRRIAGGNTVEVYNTLQPKAPGQLEKFTVRSLSPGIEYTLAIIAVDDAGLESEAATITVSTLAELPTVTDITADPAGTHNGMARTITITGANLNAGTPLVRLVKGSDIVTLSNVSALTATTFKVIVPAGTPAGTYKARVINNNGTSAPGGTYTVDEAPAPLPAVTNVSPNRADSNTQKAGVKITGKNFTGATAVAFNNTAAVSFTVNSDTQITVTAPALPAGEYNIKVTTVSGANQASTVKYIVTTPVVINNDSGEDTTTTGSIKAETGNIPVQVTLTTNNDESATKNVDINAEVSVVIPRGTSVTKKDGTAYTDTINPPQIVKPDPAAHGDIPDTAIVLEMGNPDVTIEFGQYFVATIRVEATVQPAIYYLNKDNGKYELAGKTDTLDGVNYVPGGTLIAQEELGEDSFIFTIGLLLDHMSTYVASATNLVPPAPTPVNPPTGGGSIGGGLPQVPGITSVKSYISSNGRFFRNVLAATEDYKGAISIPVGTIGLDKDGKALTVITMQLADALEPLPENHTIVGTAYDFGPGGATFAPAVILTLKYVPEELPDNINESELKIAYYDIAAGAWVLMETSVDTVNNTLITGITHFSTFAVLAQTKTEPEPSAASTPEPAIPAKTTAVEPEPTPAAEPVQTPEPIPVETQKPGPEITPETTTEPVSVPSDNKVDWPLLMVIFSGLILVVLAITIFVKHKKN